MKLGRTKAARYRLAETATGPARPVLSPEAQSVLCLVTQPLPMRPPSDYRRVLLEGYKPDFSRYLPVTVTSRWPRADATSADANLIDLVSRLTELEELLGTPLARTQPLTRDAVATWLAQPESLTAMPVVRHVRATGAACQYVQRHGGALTLTRDTLQAVFELLTPWQRTMSHLAERGLLGSATAAPSPVLLRTFDLVLPGSTYQPLSGERRIDACLRQILSNACVIQEAAEASFYLLVHLLCLQPFAGYNVTMAVLTANLPLLQSGLAPLDLVHAPVSDHYAGILGLLELGRYDLLRDTVVRV